MRRVDLRRLESIVDRMGFLGDPYNSTTLANLLELVCKNNGYEFKSVFMTSDVSKWSYNVSRRFEVKARGKKILIAMTPVYDETNTFLVSYRLDFENPEAKIETHNTVGVEETNVSQKIVALFNVVLN